MNMQIIFSVLIILLLLVTIALQLIGQKKSDLNEVASLLKAAADDMRNGVAKQISEGATEQFKRFGLIADNVNKTLQESRTETTKTLQDSRGEINKQLRDFAEQLENRLSTMGRNNNENIEKINTTLENKVKSLQESNEKRLEQMQGIVDEKLQKTLETRLTQSFELVGKQLDNVQQGLGEMKSLASDAKSLKNALINVKERGTYGEVRLEKLLADVLAPTQYSMNVEIAAGKRVEFVINLPGAGDTPLLLPIDSKFPIEDYNRLLDAEDKIAIDEARKSLATKIRTFAKEIHAKYIVPPKTTDFALMFLPTEGLYAEVVQNAALFEELRDKYKVTAVGLTTLSAFLSSLRVGFKTLALEQRSQEVWNTLRAVKKQFGEFEKSLALAHKQLQTADNTIDQIVGTRTRQITKVLRNLEEPLTDSPQLLLESDEDPSGETPPS
ncbi:MAG: DNA recombination protein RmuC [Candidatus Adiutrix sp.]